MPGEKQAEGDVITDLGLGEDVIWRMATSCSPSPVRTEREKIDRNCSRWTQIRYEEEFSITKSL